MYSGSSFRDPAGFVFEHGGNLYRQINQAGKDDYELMMSSGLYQSLVGDGLIVTHKEVKVKSLALDGLRYKIIKPQLIPFISYPYEWTFSQLKSAALLTLQLQKTALAHGMILKDASPYNVQFIGKKPIFIDTLSFRTYRQGMPWEGYKQFCEQFVAPLALAVYASPQILRSLRVFLDGIPLALAVKLLPNRARLKRGLLAHIYLHAASQKRYDYQTNKPDAKPRRLSPMALSGLLASLEHTVNVLKLAAQKTQWGDYYNDTNYSETALSSKQKIVKAMLASLPKSAMVWDFGANDGRFSQLAVEAGAYTVAFDVDYQTVEYNLVKKRRTKSQSLMLPLVQDLANPSPSLGWAHDERLSLEERGPADVVLALALIHHLAISNTTPLPAIADFFARMGRYLIIEFVPKEDSKAQLLLQRRLHPFAHYSQKHFQEAFGACFKLQSKKTVLGSRRVIYLYQNKLISSK